MHQENAQESTLRAIKKYLTALWKAKFLIGAIAILGLGIAVLIVKMSPKPYLSNQTFFIHADETSSMGGIGDLLGSVGLNENGTEDKIERIKVIGQSQRMFIETLLDSHEVGGRNDLLANHILEEIKGSSFSKSRPEMVSYRFKSSQEQTLDREAKTCLRFLIAAIQAGDIDHFEYRFLHDIRSGKMEIRTSALDEDLAFGFCRNMYENLSTYFINKSVEKPLKTFNLLKSRADSLQERLERAEFNLAAFDAQNQAMWSPKDKYKRNKLSRQVSIQTVSLTETIKNRELASFLLQNMTPYFQLIDEAFLPLPKKIKDLKQYGFLGTFIGLVLGIALVWGRLLWKEMKLI